MIVIGTELIEHYLADRAGHKGIKAARSEYQAWLDICLLYTSYLPKLISGEHVGALAMSEPGAGSDVVSMLSLIHI